ncbi:MAG: peptidoglycan-associated lipoprotein Pal [candidate division NC10 bacterium]
MMRQRRGHLLLVLPLLVLTLFLVGCPKRPATTAASAPPPTAPAPAAPAPAAVAPAPAPAAAGAGAGAGAAAPAAAAPARPAAATPPRPSEFSESPNLKDIHFDFDKYDIRPGDATILDANGNWLKQAETNLVLIEGHADERGTNEYNLALGERRAKATMNYLVSQGIQASRMTIISYGEERPACTDKNEPCWSKNRRAHFLVKAR